MMCERAVFINMVKSMSLMQGGGGAVLVLV